MTLAEYKRKWYLENRERILKKLSINTKIKQSERKRTVICPICKKEFVTSHSKVKYCENPDCKKKSDTIRAKKFQENNKEYMKSYYREYDMVNKELRKTTSRKGHLRRKYGITSEDYNKMFNEQNGKCDICGNSFEKLHIDHDHATKKIRGLLCFHCNVGLGYFNDNSDLLNKAMEYIKKHKNTH